MIAGLVLVLGLVAPPAAVAAAPANDDFAAAKLIGSAAVGFATALTLEATKQPGEPNHAGDAGGHSVWFSWTAPADGNESFSTVASDFDTPAGRVHRFDFRRSHRCRDQRRPRGLSLGNRQLPGLERA